VAVIRYLLANNAPVLAVVPATRITAGDLPINTTMPAIAVTQISGMPRLTIAMTEPNRINTDRVQVSALFKGPAGTPSGAGYPGVAALMVLVLAACPNQNGTINGVAVDSILPDIEGPDLQDDATNLFSRSRDFIVKWRSAA
jgi:hypothetical protein